MLLQLIRTLALAGLRVEMKNGLGPFLVDALERRAEAVSTMWRGGAPRGADLVFNDLSLRRKEVDSTVQGGVGQPFDKMPLRRNFPQLLGMVNVVDGDLHLKLLAGSGKSMDDPGCSGDARAGCEIGVRRALNAMILCFGPKDTPASNPASVDVLPGNADAFRILGDS